jgi:hypothetical protein
LSYLLGRHHALLANTIQRIPGFALLPAVLVFQKLAQTERIGLSLFLEFNLSSKQQKQFTQNNKRKPTTNESQL